MKLSSDEAWTFALNKEHLCCYYSSFPFIRLKTTDSTAQEMCKFGAACGFALYIYLSKGFLNLLTPGVHKKVINT